tara:strand:+ start:312 stop:668 length:357 start_codon:yes stop_codon:yes gene_type:complete
VFCNPPDIDVSSLLSKTLLETPPVIVELPDTLPIVFSLPLPTQEKVELSIKILLPPVIDDTKDGIGVVLVIILEHPPVIDENPELQLIVFEYPPVIDEFPELSFIVLPYPLLIVDNPE